MGWDGKGWDGKGREGKGKKGKGRQDRKHRAAIGNLPLYVATENRKKKFIKALWFFFNEVKLGREEKVGEGGGKWREEVVNKVYRRDTKLGIVWGTRD